MKSGFKSNCDERALDREPELKAMIVTRDVVPWVKNECMTCGEGVEARFCDIFNRHEALVKHLVHRMSILLIVPQRRRHYAFPFQERFMRDTMANLNQRQSIQWYLSNSERLLV